MINQRSSGFIIFTVVKRRVFYLLLHHGGRYWNFPKGKYEAGESEYQTAFRETEEETGIRPGNIHIIKGFRETYRYTFTVENKKKIHKESIFFLGRVDSRKVVISGEHRNFGWFSYSEALSKLFYKKSQRILRKAHRGILTTLHNTNKR